MKIQYKCLPCIVNQAIKVADMTHAQDKDVLLKKVFQQLAAIDFNKTTPEIIGLNFRLIKEHIQNEDPYKDVRNYYNQFFLDHSSSLLQKIESSSTVFEQAIKYAILGNIIDFNPIHNQSEEEILSWFHKADELSLTINHIPKLISDIKKSATLLYLGDNCGEICLDLLLIQKIKELNPNIHIYFGTRGEPVVNDSIEADAYFVGIDQYATIINNGDCSLGTVLERTSSDFKKIYNLADIVICKGQANYESLSDEQGKNIYFLLMSKCEVIAQAIGVPPKSLICLNHPLS